jgi:hypothetical protein
MRKLVLFLILFFVSSAVSQEAQTKNYFIKNDTFTWVITIDRETYLSDSFITMNQFSNKDIPDLTKPDYLKSIVNIEYYYIGYSNKTLFIQKRVNNRLVKELSRQTDLFIGTNDSGEASVSILTATGQKVPQAFKVKLQSNDVLISEVLSDISEIK